jgi:hypothetical protein
MSSSWVNPPTICLIGISQFNAPMLRRWGALRRWYWAA